MRPPTHSHPCQGECGGPCPCPVRWREHRPTWCKALKAERLLVCLRCRITRWILEGAAAARNRPALPAKGGTP